MLSYLKAKYIDSIIDRIYDSVKYPNKDIENLAGLCFDSKMDEENAVDYILKELNKEYDVDIETDADIVFYYYENIPESLKMLCNEETKFIAIVKKEIGDRYSFLDNITNYIKRFNLKNNKYLYAYES